MKKLFVLFLMVSVLFCSAAFAETGPFLYVSDFSQGTDGWEPSGTGVKLTATDGAVLTEGRTENWMGPKRSFPLLSGRKYKISVEVFQNEAGKADIMVSVAHKAAGTETYENLATGSVPRGKWTTLTGTWTAGRYDTYILYVETVKLPKLSYSIRNFRVEEEIHNPIIEGLAHERTITRDMVDYPIFDGLKTGKTYGDETLTFELLWKDPMNARIGVREIPLQTGSTRVQGVPYTVLPREDMPEELLGTWKVEYKGGKPAYYTFHADGWAGCSYDGNQFEMLEYAYSDGKILLSGESAFHIDRFDVEDGIPVPVTDEAWNNPVLKAVPSKVPEKKVTELRTVTAFSCAARPQDSEIVLLADPGKNPVREMTAGLRIAGKEKNPMDACLQIIISDPEVLEYAGYANGILSVRGKKPGTAEVSVRSFAEDAESAGPITVTVAEGEKALPEELVGKRWTCENDRNLQPSVIFDGEGRYFLYIESKKAKEITVQSGWYLYRDGLIQLGGAGSTAAWFTVKEDAGEISLECFSEGSFSGVWSRKELLTEKTKCLNGKNFVFNKYGIPVAKTAANLSMEKLWERCYPFGLAVESVK